MTLQFKVALTRALVLSSYSSLLVLFVSWYLFLNPVEGANPWVPIIVQSTLLLAFSGVIIKGQPRGHAWLCFVLLVYFMHAVLVASNPATQEIGIVYSALIVILFSASMYFARWKSQLTKLKADN